MHDLVEVIEKSKDLKSMKEKLLECFKSEANTKGFECMDHEEAKDVIDMIKDLAEAECKCMESLYYQKVIEAMTSYNEPRYGESGSFGYNPNRSKTTGQYMSNRSSDGGRHGFRPHTPFVDYMNDMNPDDYMREAMMGYSPNKMMSERSVDSWNDADPRYGKAYNEYRTRRRHFTETKSMDDKKEMELHAEEHVRDTIATIRDIWHDADPTLKKRMKEDFTKLVGEMTI